MTPIIEHALDVPPARSAEVTALATKLARSKRASERSALTSRLCTNCVRFVAGRVRRLCIQCRPGTARWDDLVSAGLLAVARKARDFDPDRGASFLGYIGWWVDVEVRRAVRDTAPCLVSGTHRHLPEAVAASRSTALALDMETVGDRTLHEIVADPQEPGPEERLAERAETDDARRRIDEALARLPARARIIMRRCYLSEPPATLEVVGGSLGITRERVRQIANEALRQVARNLQIRAGGRIDSDPGRIRRDWHALRASGRRTA